MKKTVYAIVILWVFGFLCPGTALTEEPAKTGITVMSYNIYRGGTMRGQPLSQTVKVIQEAKADIVGIQETRSPSGMNAEKLAQLLGWNYHEDRGNRVIITRYEIVEKLRDGIKVRLPSGQEAYLFNLHLPSHPYQPYQLLKIRPKWHKHTNNIEFIKTEAEAIEWAEKARGAAITALLEQINQLPDQDAPVFVVGDFNEPSHLDWTEKAAASGRHPIKVAYPASNEMAQAGFADAWRTLYPDEMEQPGYTWSPAYPFDDPTTHPDRIDFVYYRGEGVSLEQAKIVGENKENADLVVSPYPSDHRAVVATFSLPNQTKPNPAADQAAFEKAEGDTAWAEVFSDSGTADWQEQWFLDGEVGTVTNSPKGMTLTAGPEFKNDAHHMVLWTKESFSGDLKIEYDYTRLDEAPNCVTILYLQATGSGKGPYAKDITKWNDLRKVPAMKMYFNHMNTYHISYAAHPGTEKAYIRGRRYLPENEGLNGTELNPDYSTPTLFATGVKHHITVIKKDRDLHVRVENPDKAVYFHMNNPDLPAITEGRIGLRHMFTRSARYANFRVSQPAAPAPAETAAGLSDAQIQQLRETAAARRRAAFESESGTPFAPREIQVDWNDRGDFTRHYIQDVIHFATRALTLNEQIDEANLALREMCQYHLDRPQTLLEIHSFPNAPRFLARLSLLYGPDGSRTKGLISEETHAVILKTLWTWCQSKLKIADTAVEPWHTWTGHSSENHHANHFASCWAATLLLSREPVYRDLIADQHTVNEHYAAWTAWIMEYLRQRGRKGMTVEIDSASYSQATLAAIYLIHDLAEEPELRQLASHYMTLAWALWAEQQIQGVNGGAKTRHYPDSAKRSENPLSAAAWYVLGSDDLPQPKRPPTSAILTSTWQIPDVVLDIAFDVSGRGAYEAIQRKPGLRPAEETEPCYKIHLAPDAPALVRYTYATPDFIMGSLFCDALPVEAWNNISSQNRWHGAIFAGDRNARIYPYGETKKSHYNAHWAAQKRGTLIAQKLKTSKGVAQHRVWFSREGLSEPIQEGAWYFAEADSTYAAVRVVSGEATFEDEVTDQRARILNCADDLSPVILEVARKADFPDFKTFRKTVQALPFAFDGTVLTYTGLSNDRFTFFADQSERPQINGKPIDLGPEKVYESPFVQSDWDSGIVTIQFGDKKQILDFNETSKP